MMNREERRGYLWIGLFLVLIVLLAVMFILTSDPATHPATQPRLAARPPLRLGALAGRTVHAYSGAPIAPQVRVLDLAAVSAHWIEEPDPGAPGQFEVAGLPADLDFRIEIGAAGFETRARQVRVPVGGMTDLGDIALRPRIAVRGFVRDGFAQGVAGREVEAIVLESGEIARTSTGSDGAFEFDQLLAEVVAFHVRGPSSPAAAARLLDLRANDRCEILVLDDELGVPLAGRVATELATDRPDAVVCAGTRLVLEPGDGFRFAALAAGRNWLEFPGPRGECSVVPVSAPLEDAPIDLAPLVRIRVRALAPGDPAPVYLGLRSIATATDGRVLGESFAGSVARTGEPVELSLRPAASIELLACDTRGNFCLESLATDAMDETDEPLEVELVPAENVAPLEAGTTVELLPATAAERSALRFVAPAAGTIAALDSSLLLLAVDAEMPTLPRGRVSTAWRARTGQPEAAVVPALEGVIVDAQDVAVADAAVRLDAWGDRSAWTHALRTTRADGSFEIPLPDPALLTALVVEHPQFARAVILRPQAGPLRVVLRPPRSLRLAVVDEKGAPLAGARVELDAPIEDAGFAVAPGLGTRSRATNAEGQVAFSNLPAGIYGQVAVEYADFVTAPGAAFDLREQSGAQLRTIRCYRPRRLLLRVQDPGGQPVAGAVVEIRGGEDWSELRVASRRADSAGEVQVEGLPPPPWWIDVFSPAYRPTLAARVEEGPEHTLVLEPLATIPRR